MAYGPVADTSDMIKRGSYFPDVSQPQNQPDVAPGGFPQFANYDLTNADNQHADASQSQHQSGPVTAGGFQSGHRFEVPPAAAALVASDPVRDVSMTDVSLVVQQGCTCRSKSNHLRIADTVQMRLSQTISENASTLPCSAPVSLTPDLSRRLSIRNIVFPLALGAPLACPLTPSTRIAHL